MTSRYITALLLAVLILLPVLCFSGCSKDEEETTEPSTEVSENAGEFTPTDGILSITVPSCAVDIIEDNLYAMAASFGITDIRDGAGGSLICYMATADKAQVQMAAKQNLYSSTEYLAGGTDFVISAEIGYDCDSITFFCDGSSYVEPSEEYLMAYYVPVMTYHALATPDKDFLFNKKVTFTFIDNETLSELDSFEFRGETEKKE